MDTHSALDRGTIPILPSNTFQHPPLTINDDDMSVSHGVTALPSLETTDMSHSAMTYEAMLCQRQMYELSLGGGDCHHNWSKRLQLVANFGAYVQHISTRVGDSSSPLDMLLKVSGRKIYVSLELLLRRPPYRQSFNSVPSTDEYDVMLAATEVLEQHLQAPPPELRPWAWKNWVQWHALAVILAELLVRSRESLSDRAYAVAAKAFGYYAQIVADSQSGMLWKPIEKLMRRVQRMRQKSTLQATQELLIASPVTPEAPQDLSQFEQLFSVDDDLFESSKWSLDDQATTKFMDDVDQANLAPDLDYDNMPWLAWDSFLEDMIDYST